MAELISVKLMLTKFRLRNKIKLIKFCRMKREIKAIMFFLMRAAFDNPDRFSFFVLVIALLRKFYDFTKYILHTIFIIGLFIF
jgi:hypothetical protein